MQVHSKDKVGRWEKKQTWENKADSGSFKCTPQTLLHACETDGKDPEVKKSLRYDDLTMRPGMHPMRTCSSTISVCALAAAITATVLLFQGVPSNDSGALGPPQAACSTSAPDTSSRAARWRKAARAMPVDSRGEGSRGGGSRIHVHVLSVTRLEYRTAEYCAAGLIEKRFP